MIFRGYYWLGVIALIWMGLQIAPVTRLVFHPQAVSIKGGIVTLVRSFPMDRFGLPRPRMSYVETVKPMTEGWNGGHPCVHADGPFFYSRATEVGTWDIGRWAGECLSDPAGVVWSASWTWHLGILHLGPVHFSDAIPNRSGFRPAPDRCRYRVSSRGVIHSRASPHFAMVSPDRCFERYHDARAYAEKLID